MGSIPIPRPNTLVARLDVQECSKLTDAGSSPVEGASFLKERKFYVVGITQKGNMGITKERTSVIFKYRTRRFKRKDC